MPFQKKRNNYKEKEGKNLKGRYKSDNIGVSSGSSHNAYHPKTPLSQLHDILASSVEQSSSMDHNDAKDLSFRSSYTQQTLLITPPSLHHDLSGHDLDSSRDALTHSEIEKSHSPLTNPTNSDDSLLIQAARIRNFSESFYDVEHNNNYKYKNHIKERFNQDHLHDETSSELCTPTYIQSDISEHSKDDVEIESSAVRQRIDEKDEDVPVSSSSATTPSNETNAHSFSNIKSELSNNIVTHLVPLKHTMRPSTPLARRPVTIPIFALHNHGTYYVALNIDYNILRPCLNGIDLLDKNCLGMPALHPININVDFAPTRHPINKTKIETNSNRW